MKLLELSLFAFIVGCCQAVVPVPNGCGISCIEACNAAKPYVSIRGQKGLDELNAEVLQLRAAIAIGDIRRLSNLFKNVGSPGYRNVAATTSDACLRRVFLSLADVENYVAFLLLCIKNPIEAGEIVCNALSYEAQQINGCIATLC